MSTPSVEATLQQENTLGFSKIDRCLFVVIAVSLVFRLFFMGSSDLLVEEAYYWNYAQHLDFGYLDHPPMVALLIKLSTTLLGNTSLGIRITSIVCWLIMAFFSFKLSNLIQRGSGRYCLFFLSMLPFFFLQSLVITPDQPLVACWSAALYCLYRSIVLNEAKYWYAVGVCLGLGMISKYTIALLGPATLLYLGVVPSARQWFSRKEPYIAVFIATLFFTPVLYWNATHDWASFVFQGSRRLESDFYFSFHHFIGLLIVFLFPPGIWSLWRLMRGNLADVIGIKQNTKRFFQIYALAPLAVFALFSLRHPIKFDWIGPPLLALIPWLAVVFVHKLNCMPNRIVRYWLIDAAISTPLYAIMIMTIAFGTPEVLNHMFLRKFIDWRQLTQQFNDTALQIERESQVSPIFVSLETYNISSEFTFYQNDLAHHGEIQKQFPIVGRHIFNMESLMYRYWADATDLSGKTLILISTDLHEFQNRKVIPHIVDESPIKTIWAQSQGRGKSVQPYYYRIVKYVK